jgi:hypothetical protein
MLIGLGRDKGEPWFPATNIGCQWIFIGANGIIIAIRHGKLIEKTMGFGWNISSCPSVSLNMAVKSPQISI